MKIDCVFIHGWAMNSAVWQPCLQRVPDWIKPQCIDLPGYGENSDVSATTLDDYVEHVAQQISRPVLVVGWSLGGLVSLKLAQRYPEKVSALLQVATNPKFVQHGDWRTAVEASVFEQFASSLEKDRVKTIRRFLALAGTWYRYLNANCQGIAALNRCTRAAEDRGLIDGFEDIVRY